MRPAASTTARRFKTLHEGTHDILPWQEDVAYADAREMPAVPVRTVALALVEREARAIVDTGWLLIV